MKPSSTSSTASGPPPVYRLTPSRQLRAFLIVVPGLALFALIGLPGLPIGVRGVAGCFVLVVSIGACRWHWPGQPAAVARFAVQTPDRIRLWRFDGAAEEGAVTDRLILPSLVVLSISRRWPGRVIVVPADALDGETHRRLRRSLRHH